MSQENVALARKAIDALNRGDFVWENAEEGVHIEIEQITDLGDDRVFIAVVLTARHRGSDMPFEYRPWQIVGFADGLITRRQVFWTRAEALKTAGLRE